LTLVEVFAAYPRRLTLVEVLAAYIRRLTRGAYRGP